MDHNVSSPYCPRCGRNGINVSCPSCNAPAVTQCASCGVQPYDHAETSKAKEKN